MKLPIKEIVLGTVLAIGLVAQSIAVKADHMHGGYARPPAPTGWIVPDGSGYKVTYDEYGRVIQRYDGYGNPIARHMPRQRVIPQYQVRPMYPPQYVYPDPGAQMLLGVLGIVGDVLIARQHYKLQRRYQGRRRGHR